MKTCKTLSELYSHHGFRARSKLTGVYGDPYARVIKLVRRQKNRLLCLSYDIKDLLRQRNQTGKRPFQWFIQNLC